MNILADESVDRPIIARLRQDGHAVEAIEESAPSISDDDVLARAEKAGQIVLTADKDFGDLVYRRRQAHAGVILLRPKGILPEDRPAIISEVLRVHESSLAGAFTVVTRDAIKIRPSSLP